MTKYTLYQVDAFTDSVFGGNPAAVCFMDALPANEIMQKIALENNLPETAFVIKSDDPAYDFHLRWFTPTVEMDLCGHATLATGYCLFEETGFAKEEIRFQSRSGLLSVRKTSRGYTLNFPSTPFSQSQDTNALQELIGLKVLCVLHAPKTYAVLDETPETIKNYVPDITKIKTLQNTLGLVITARGNNGVDFVSRLFAPQIGIDEDPVTGATHCVLAPYWGGILGKSEMIAHQLSPRGGKLHLELQENNRVAISGNAVLYMKGEIFV